MTTTRILHAGRPAAPQRRAAACRLRSLAAAVATACLALMLCACERRPLEVMLGEEVRVDLVIDWVTNHAEIYKEQPNGMTVMVWGSDLSRPVKVTSVNGHRVSFLLPPDTYRLLVHNETSQEFAYQSFHDYYDYVASAMRSSHYTSVKAWDAGVDYIQYPDPVGITAAEFVISDDMAESDTIIFIPYEDWRKNGASYYDVPVRLYTIEELAWPMTVNLAVRAKVRRPQSLASIEGAISGMAEGFYLSRVNRTAESGSLRLVNDDSYRWSFETRGEPQDSAGYIHFTIPSFGLPYGRELLAQRRDSDNMLAFHFTLTDGTVIDTTFAVGRQIRYITPEGREAEIRYREDLYNLELEIDLDDEIIFPPSDSDGGNAGFDADVDRWDDEEVDLGGF